MGNKAVNKGVLEAQMLVGLMYLFGMGVEKDYSKSRELLKLSSSKMGCRAYNFLGWIYENGKDVKIDLTKAEKF